MAYTDRLPLSRRLASLGTAGAIELAIGVALIAGLSTTFVPEEEAPQLTARNIPDPAPPPPDASQPQPRDRDTVIEAPQTPIDLTSPADTEVTIADEFPEAFERVIPPLDPPRVTPSPRIPPVAAAPANSAAGWVTSDDYPARDLREGNQGVTGFRVIVGSNGRVQSCEITRSSGFAGLDKAVCANVTRRARFKPATDETGAKVVGSYANTVRWQIPR